MIVGIIAGQEEGRKFPGRNSFPLLGRPMMVYPILAARHSRRIDRVFLTTDSPTMAEVAGGMGVEVLSRSPECSGRNVRLADVFTDAAEQIGKRFCFEPEAYVLLLCNAPTLTDGLIDHGVEALLNDTSLDAVVSVSLHNEFHPSRALKIGEGGRLLPHDAKEEVDCVKDEDAYFPDALLWVVRPHLLCQGSRGLLSDFIVEWRGHRVLPLVHEGYGDVDYPWQVPGIEEWLRRHGFSQHETPYKKRGSDSPRIVVAQSSLRHVGSQRVLITTVPFGEVDKKPLELLEDAGIEYTINPLGRRLQSNELADLIEDFDALIAGTEPITAETIRRGKRLRLVSRVGIGLDSVDLRAAREREVLVSYTPDAPAPAVAEMTVGLMISALRSLSQADRGLRAGVWHRIAGRRLAELTVGVIGVGRVGKRVIRHLEGFGARILANDPEPDAEFGLRHLVCWVDKDTLFRGADVITLHVPLTPRTRNLIGWPQIQLMKPDAVLINASRGGMVNEHDLAQALKQGRLAAAALDVFGQEPYSGELVTVENCLLTCHMGSMSRDCRARMELEATEEVIRYFRGEPLRLLVPESEYLLRGDSDAG